MIRGIHAILLLALALVIAITHTILAGENAGAVFRLVSEDQLEIVPGETVKTRIAASGLVDVQEIEIQLKMSPARAFDLPATAYEVPTAWLTAGQSRRDNQPSEIDRFFSAELTTSPEFGTLAEALITVDKITISTSEARSDEFDGGDLRMSIAVRPVATAVGESGLPFPETFLSQNFPNPFNAQTIIRIDLERAASITLTVYDATGQTVRTLVSGAPLEAGTHALIWDGHNKAGDMVSSGVYFYELRTDNKNLVRKMMLLQ